MLAAQIYRNVIMPLPPVPSLVPIYKTTLTTTTDEATTTWTDVDIGVPHPKRVIILAGCAGVAAAVASNVNGAPGVLHWAGTNGTRSGSFFIQGQRVPMGERASIVVSATSSLRKIIGVYVAYPNQFAPLDTGSVTANTTTDANVANIKAQAGGFLIYAGGQLATLGTFTTTWNGTNGTLTENYDAQTEAATSVTHGFISQFSASSDQDDVNMAESTSGTKQLVVVSWGPPYV